MKAAVFIVVLLVTDVRNAARGLPLIGIRLDSLFVAVGIGIGLGLQKIAENFISDLLILFARPIKVGDRIHVGGLERTVVEIQSRGTVAQTKKNRRAAMSPAIDLLLRTR